MTDKPDRVTESVVERLRKYGSRPADESARGFIGTYISLCAEAATALEALTTRSQPGEDAVERAARAIAEARHGVGTWSRLNEVEQNDFRYQARAALNAAQGVTDAMVDAGLHAARSVGMQDAPVTIIYQAMQRAALNTAAPPVEEWQTKDAAPHAMSVLAARFDDSFGEWIYGVVLSPPSAPFTHWRLLPDPPALTPSEDK